MTSGHPVDRDPLDRDDVAALRGAGALARVLPARDREALAELAGRLEPVVGLAPEARSSRLPEVLRRPDVELVRGVATRLRAAGGEASGRGETEPIVRRLDALALTLASYVPPKNGG